MTCLMDGKAGTLVSGNDDCLPRALKKGVIYIMKVYEGRNKKGQLIFFEVPNSFLTRKAAVRIIREIPGAQILKEAMGEDVFCTFKLGGRMFELMEPFGDNSRYHIGEASVQYSPELQLLMDKLSAH